MKKLFSVFYLLLSLAVTTSQAQCAMCRTTLENNISQGNPGIAAGINFGILYLLATPYIAIGLIGFFWFRASRRNASSKINEGAITG
jgi:hypothetical protein